MLIKKASRQEHLVFTRSRDIDHWHKNIRHLNVALIVLNAVHAVVAEEQGWRRVGARP